MVDRMEQAGGSWLLGWGTWPLVTFGTQLWSWSGWIPPHLIEAFGCLLAGKSPSCLGGEAGTAPRLALTVSAQEALEVVVR